MSHPLLKQVHAIQRRARRLVVLQGTFVFLALACLAIAVVGLSDYVFRFQDPGLRVIGSASVLGVLVSAFWRYVLPALRFRRGDIYAAQRIERHFPPLSDRLSTAVAFLSEQPEQQSGSPELRDAAISETVQAIEGVRLGDCLTARGAWRAGGWLFAILAVTAGICAFDVRSSLLAGRRLVMPLSNEAWPRRNVLVFVKHPRRLAVGDDFEVELMDAAGRLPEEVLLQYRFEDDEPARIQAKPMKSWGDRMIARLDNVTRPLDYRAVGGDDDTMQWIHLEVLEPPRISDLKIELHPPAYTRLPTETSSRHIRAWEGTRVHVTGRVDKPLRSVAVLTQTQGEPRKLPCRLLEGGRQFALDGGEWVLNESGQYCLELEDQSGFSSTDLRESQIHVQKDMPPTISLAFPTAHRHYTAQALVPIRAIVKDDLAICRVQLKYNGQFLDIYVAPEEILASEESELAMDRRGESRVVEYAWDLGTLSDAPTGGTVDIELVASDFKPQEGHSAIVRLSIISPAELQARLDQRQIRIAERLREALRLQRTARAQTRSLEIQVRETGSLSSGDVDYLQSAELNQRQVDRVLTGDHEGVLRLTLLLLEDLQSNRLEQPQIVNRLTKLLKTVRQIAQDDLPAVQHQLTRALKLSRAGLAETKDSGGESQSALMAAGESQDSVIRRLEGLLDRLSQWEDYRQLAHDVGAIRREQQEIVHATSALETTGRDVRSLAGHERASLKRLTQRQLDVAREFERLQSRLIRSRDELAATEPLAAATLDDAAKVTRRLGLGGLMRESARHLDENQTGQSARSQTQILNGLGELLDVLANRRDQALGRVVRKLSEARQELDRLLQQEQALAGDIDQAVDSADPDERAGQLAERQRQLAVQAHELAEHLDGLQAATTGENVDRAAEQMDRGAAASEKGELADAAAAGREAIEHLQEAQSRMEQQMREARRSVQQARLAQLKQVVEEFVGRQQAICEDTRHAAPANLETLPDEQRTKLVREQLAVARDTAECAGGTDVSGPFAFALQRAARPMQEAALLLGQTEWDSRVFDLQSQALQRLRSVLESLETKPPAATPPKEEPGEKREDEAAQPPSWSVAEVRLLRSLQLEIQQRTVELDSLRPTGTVPPEVALRMVELATDQGRLAELVQALLSGAAPADEEAETKSDEPPESDLDRALEDAGIPGFSEF